VRVVVRDVAICGIEQLPDRSSGEPGPALAVGDPLAFSGACDHLASEERTSFLSSV
jgi:hypothetical protein